MTATPASPRAVLGEPLDELERLTKEAQHELDGYARAFDRPVHPGGTLYRNICRELYAACTPKRIAQLVADAARYHELRRLLFEDMEEVERLRCLSPSRMDAYLSVPKLRAARAPAGPPSV